MCVCAHACVRARGRVFTAGHNHRVSITSCPRYYAHAAGKVVMWEARPGVTRSSQLQVHHNVDAKKKKKTCPRTWKRSIRSPGKGIDLCPFPDELQTRWDALGIEAVFLYNLSRAFL